MAINLDEVLINLLLGIVIVSPFLWASGRLLVGKEKAKFTDAIWIVVLGIIIGGILGVLFVGVIAFVIQLLIWLGLIKYFFDCGWLKALAISILAVFIFMIVTVILSIVGFGIWTWI
ncbi:hypothetical protein AKJ50_01830 [candidate division MSBL1 archaeon SCGC-AAA382A13]|uniref:Yip1 domain-containing protein n=1 Tax=candidate division MSBL1 archaeon SCGC-AAA382A13 TaxID=1698279 RepID=A0A133VF02_9EURY|nr:hypothetical protein AKJ50_01830 [candidate division MSBL1 archaeon SCGC-AAA382A13]